MNQLEKAKKIVECLNNKKGHDITILHIGPVTTLADYFVIATGSSGPQIKSLADEVIKKMSEEKLSPRHIEGYNSAAWVLIDYADVVVHIFSPEMREFYGIERLWTDAEAVDGSLAE